MSFGYIIFTLILSIVYKQATALSSVYLSSNATETGIGTESDPCPSMRCALLVAEDQAIIYVNPGYYSGANNTNICSTDWNCNQKYLQLIGIGDHAEDVIFSCNTINTNRFMYINDDLFSFIQNIHIQHCLSRYYDMADITDPTRSGGGLYIKNTAITIQSVIFSNNSAYQGGAIDAIGNSSLSVYNSKFYNNLAYVEGGAISAVNSIAHIESNEFISNNATGVPLSETFGRGGGLYFNAAFIMHKLYVFGNVFDSNLAHQSGGAVYMQSISRGKQTFYSFNNTYIRNLATGQGICLSTTSCNVQGGAIFLNTLSSIIENDNFISNGVSSTNPTSISSEGGALSLTNFVQSEAAIFEWALTIVHNCKFIDNYAGDYGGGIFSINQRVKVTDCAFQSNVAGLKDDLFSDMSSSGGAIWYSASYATSTIHNCSFNGNSVYGGWGGAVYVTESQFGLYINSSVFYNNAAMSSYTYSSQGGAIMASRDTYLSIKQCIFQNNSATPRSDLIPLTYSGFGGAIYVQSAGANISDSVFQYNFALTGQFDVGGSGGAVTFIDVVKGGIIHCEFHYNGAAGYYGFSSYASSGSGGAVMTKFSTYLISYCEFTNNWVSAGGLQLSTGGAIAMFYETEVGTGGSTIEYSSFTNNSALSQTCSNAGSKSGQGGAVSIIGASVQGIIVFRSNFTGNVALSSLSGTTSAFGAGISISSYSNVTVVGCRFIENTARHGAGADISSVAETQAGVNTIKVVNSYFAGLTKISSRQAMNARIDHLNTFICDQLNALYDAPSSSSSGYRGRRLLTIHDNATLYELYQRELALASTFTLQTNIIQHHASTSNIGVLVTSGNANMINPTFASSYHVFFGDIGVVLSSVAATSYQGTNDYFLDPCIGSIYGHINIDETDGPSGLILTAIRSEVAIANTLFNNVQLDELHLLNASLYVSNNMTILSNSSIISSIISTLTLLQQPLFFHLPLKYVLSSSANAVIRFRGFVSTGIGSTKGGSISFATTSDDDNTDDTFSNPYVPKIELINCTVMIYGILQLSAVIDGAISADTSSTLPLSTASVIVWIRGSAVLNITSSGILQLYTHVHMIADASDSIAVYNDGQVQLLGQRSSPASAGLSLYSTLTVYGDYIQTPSGSMSLYLNHSYENVPVLNFTSNHTLLGSVVIAFIGDPELELYTDNPSTFDIAEFTKVGPSASGQSMSIISPSGLEFANNMVYSSAYDVWMQSFVLTSISCDTILSYYSISSSDMATQYPCYVCLLNNSCSYCGSSSICYDKSSSPSSTSTCSQDETFTSTCCHDDCNHPNGDCVGKDDNTEFSCQCNDYYSQSTCAELSLESILLITAAVFLFSLALITFFYYRYSRNQRTHVLEELRRNLLKTSDGSSSGKAGNVDPHYIRSVQQALVLQDVFVKYEELKIEAQIGEGSFGVVYRATFRGAQVAVKQMRSVLMEITEAEIEEFRKEAYMMSRLRHPNIVLVMGISLIDQDIKAPAPAKKSINPAWGSDDEAGRYVGNPMQASMANPNPTTATTSKTLPQTICIITEYLEQGSLADILYGPRRLPADIWTYDLILTCALQAARGMLYLHSHSPPICHRDLKSSNLVVDDHWVVKVTDFGMSRIVPEKVQDIQKGLAKDDGPIGDALRESYYVSNSGNLHGSGNTILSSASSHDDDSINSISALRASVRGMEGRASIYNLEMTSNLGTTAWCAPELLTAATKTRYSVKVDVYSFGMVLWELWEKKRPFEEYNSRFDIIDAIRAGVRPTISEDCPPVFKSLIQRCWQADPTRRPTFQSIVKYIKDEHAMIRRQRTASSYNPRFDSNPVDISSSVASSSAMASSATSTSQPDNDSMSILRKFSFNNPFGNSGGSHHASPSASEAATPTQYHLPSWISTSPSTSAYPPSRSPLVASALEGNLQQLAMTPVNTSSGGGILNSKRFLSSKKVAKSTSSSTLSSSEGGGSGGAHEDYLPPTPVVHEPVAIVQKPPVPAPSPLNRGNPNAWRDKFVMRHTGWNAAQPDTGLPPAFHPASVSSTAGSVSSSSSSGVASTPSPVKNVSVSSTTSSTFGIRAPMPSSESHHQHEPLDIRMISDDVMSNIYDEDDSREFNDSEEDPSEVNSVHASSTQPIAIPGAKSAGGKDGDTSI